WCREIREHVDRHLGGRPDAAGEQQRREHHHHPVMIDGPLNQPFHRTPSQCTWPSAGNPLAAEASCTSYAPLITTRSPTATPRFRPIWSLSRVAISTYRRANRSPPVCTKTYGRPASSNTAAFGTVETRTRSRVYGTAVPLWPTST